MFDTSKFRSFSRDQSNCTNALLAILSAGATLAPMDGIRIGGFESRAVEPLSEGLCLAVEGSFGQVAIAISPSVLEHLLDGLLPGWRDEPPAVLPLDWQITYVWDLLFQGTFLAGLDIRVLPELVTDPDIPILTGTIDVMGTRMPIDFAILKANTEDPIWNAPVPHRMNAQIPCRLMVSTEARNVSFKFVEDLESGDIIFLKSAGDEESLSVEVKLSNAIGWYGSLDLSSDNLQLTHMKGDPNAHR